MRAPRVVQHHQLVGAPADGVLLDVGEERAHGVEVARAEGIELVVVALGAAQGRAKPCGRHRPYSIGGVLGSLFNAIVAPSLFDRAAEYPLGIALTR